MTNRSNLLVGSKLLISLTPDLAILIFSLDMISPSPVHFFKTKR